MAFEVVCACGQRCRIPDEIEPNAAIILVDHPDALPADARGALQRLLGAAGFRSFEVLPVVFHPFRGELPEVCAAFGLMFWSGALTRMGIEVALSLGRIPRLLLEDWKAEIGPSSFAMTGDDLLIIFGPENPSSIFVDVGEFALAIGAYRFARADRAVSPDDLYKEMERIVMRAGRTDGRPAAALPSLPGRSVRRKGVDEDEGVGF